MYLNRKAAPYYFIFTTYLKDYLVMKQKYSIGIVCHFHRIIHWKDFNSYYYSYFCDLTGRLLYGNSAENIASCMEI